MKTKKAFDLSGITTEKLKRSSQVECSKPDKIDKISYSGNYVTVPSLFLLGPVIGLYQRHQEF